MYVLQLKTDKEPGDNIYIIEIGSVDHIQLLSNRKYKMVEGPTHILVFKRFIHGKSSRLLPELKDLSRFYT